jgi:hypothetical protein
MSVKNIKIKKKYTPIVKVSAMDECFMSVKRLKEGPPNLTEIICDNQLY